MSIFDQVLENTYSSLSNSQPVLAHNLLDELTIKSEKFGLRKVEPKDGAKLTPDQWFESAFGFDVVRLEERWNWKGKEMASKDNLLIRSDTGEKLANVSGRYQIVQPKQMVDFFSDMVDHFGWEIEQMGYCDNGKKLFAFAKTGSHTWDATGKGDKMLNHLLITTSCDGSMATLIQPFMHRFFCMNQLPMARKMFKPLKIRHSTEFKPNEIKFNLGLYGETNDYMRDAISKMVKRRVNNQEALSAIYSILADNDKPVEEQSTRRLNQVLGIYDKYRGQGMGSREEGVQGTMWGVLNAITEFTDHEQGNNENNRFRSSHYGAGFELKNDAFEILDMYTNEEKELKLIEID